MLKELEVEYGLTQLVNSNTRPLYSNTIIDLIFTNNKDFSHPGTINYNVSDHLPTFIIRKKIKAKQITTEFIGRTYKNYSKEILTEKLLAINWEEQFQLQNPNLAWDFFISNLLPILNEICPIKKSKCTTNSRPPWITHELIELANDRDKAMRIAKRAPLAPNIAHAKALRNESKLAFKRVREEYIKNQLDEHKNDPKKFWSELENIIPGKKNCSSNILNLLNDNNEELSKDITSTCVNDFFSTIGSRLASEMDPLSIEEKQSIDNIMTNNYSLLPLLQIRDFSLEELVKEIENINIYKSSGITNISSHILKDVWTITPNLLLDVLNKSISQVIFSDAWKIGTIIPIPKVTNPQHVTDLRPITLLPLPGKVLERLIHNKLYPYLEEHNVLSPFQNGFRKHHGTSDAIFKFISDITDGFNHKKPTLAVFIDFKKAFDTLDFEILLGKLTKFNFSKNLLTWLKNYLTNKKQSTFMNNISSNISPITHGVPQGSILGPLLFNLYINDLAAVISCKLILYADDSVLYATSDSVTELFHTIQQDMINVDRWCKYHKLTMNIKKTKTMCFSSNPVHGLQNLYIQLGNDKIETVPVYKYLGIQLDCKLFIANIMKHINLPRISCYSYDVYVVT